MNKRKNQNKQQYKQYNRYDETAEPKNVNPENTSNIFSDVLGSYTGIAEDGGRPVQDADDL